MYKYKQIKQKYFYVLDQAREIAAGDTTSCNTTVQQIGTIAMGNIIKKLQKYKQIK